jgi:hypothetical protein
MDLSVNRLAIFRKSDVVIDSPSAIAVENIIRHVADVLQEFSHISAIGPELSKQIILPHIRSARKVITFGYEYSGYNLVMKGLCYSAPGGCT